MLGTTNKSRRRCPARGCAESAPSLTGRPASLDHVFGDARLRDCKPELEQFTMDTRSAPQWVLNAHPPN
jgi:hypothetical protein